MDASILKLKEDLLEKVKLAVIDGNEIIVGKYVLDVLNSKEPSPLLINIVNKDADITMNKKIQIMVNSILKTLFQNLFIVMFFPSFIKI